MPNKIVRPPVTNLLEKGVTAWLASRGIFLPDDKVRALKLDTAWDNKAPHILVSYGDRKPHRTVLAQSLTYSQGKRPNRIEVLVEAQNGKIHAGRVKVNRSELRGLVEEIAEGRFDVMGRAYATGQHQTALGLFVQEHSTTAHYAPTHNHIGRLVEYGVTWLEEHMRSHDAAAGTIHGDRRLFAAGKEDLVNVFKQVETVRKSALFQAFVECLNPEIVRFLTDEGLDNRDIYGWLAYGRHRLEAGTALPHLVHILPQVSQDVDEGKSVLDGVARLLAQTVKEPPSKTAVQFLGLRGPVPAGLSHDDLRLYAHVLNGIDPTWYPTTAAEWSAFTSVMRYIKSFVDVTGKDWSECWKETATAVKDPKSRWQQVLTKMQALGTAENVRDIEDWKSSILGRLVGPKVNVLSSLHAREIPAVGWETLTNKLLGKMLTEYGMWDVLEASHRYHIPEQLRMFRNRLEAIRTGNGENETYVPPTMWLPIAPPRRFHKDGQAVWMFPLLDELELRKQADIQGHCVHGYGSACLYNGSHIVALVDEATIEKYLSQPLADVDKAPDELRQQLVNVIHAPNFAKDDWAKVVTVEWCENMLNGSLMGFTFRQAQGLWRRAPHPLEGEAIQSYIPWITGKKDWKEKAKELELGRIDRTRFRPDALQGDERLYGFNWRERSQREAVFMAARPFLATATERNYPNLTEWVWLGGLKDMIREEIDKGRDIQARQSLER
ncbi:MAG: hypothetical protein WAZ18_01700 [Alphaproteobacteria bacterium]